MKRFFCFLIIILNLVNVTIYGATISELKNNLKTKVLARVLSDYNFVKKEDVEVSFSFTRQFEELVNKSSSIEFDLDSVDRFLGRTSLMVSFFDKAIATPGTLNAYSDADYVGHIGFARVRNIDEEDGNFLNLYLFDIKMFTMLSIAVTSNNFKAGDKVTGSVSGATGIVAYEDASNNHIMVHDVVGTFTTNDALTLKGAGTYSSSSTLSAVRSFHVEDARGVGQETSDTGEEDFTANVATDNDKLLSGVASITAGGAITGLGTAFLTELRKGDIIIVGNKIEIRLEENSNTLPKIEMLNSSIKKLLSEFGSIPLPPYITRAADEFDKEYYQTIFAENDGSVAAPTASLHFDSQVMKRLEEKKINICNLTLHIGMGTFSAIKTQHIEDHIMHSELFSIPKKTIEQIKKCKEKNGKVVAVGTTVARALESFNYNNNKTDTFYETNIFIKPGYKFKIVDHLITNFHLPKSSLLIMIAAFYNKNKILEAYDYAKKNDYKFFSYGDSTLIL